MKIFKKLFLGLLLLPLLVVPSLSDVVKPVVRPVVYDAVWNVTSYGGGGSYLPQTLAYVARVETDGGTVIDIDFVNDAFKDMQDNDYDSDVVTAYDPNWGIKTGVQGATKLYSLTGSDYDLEQATQSKEPVVNVASINGKNTLTYGATNKHLKKAFTLAQPEIIIALVKSNALGTVHSIFSGYNSANNMTFFLGAGSQGISTCIRGGNVVYAEPSYLLQSNLWRVATICYNGTASFNKINDAYCVSYGVDIGTSDGDGLTIGGDVLTSANVDIGTTYILSTTTTAKHNLVRDFINLKYDVYGKNNKIVFMGDSLTIGSSMAFNEAYPDVTVNALENNWDYYNIADNGKTLVVASTETANIDSYYDSSLDENICVVWLGTNDLALEWLDGEQAYTTLKAYCQGRKTAGFKVIALTCLPRTSGVNFETWRTTLNNSIKTDLVNYVDAIVDVASNEYLDDQTDTTYYNADECHLIEAGYAVVAGLVAPVIESILD